MPLSMQGVNSTEAQKLALAAYKVNLLKTISLEGEYSLQVEPWIPVKFIYQAGQDNTYSRVGVKFHSGSDFLLTDEVRLFGLMNGSATGVYNGQSLPTTTVFDLIPTQALLTFGVGTTIYGYGAMSGTKVKLHIFQ